MSDPIEKAAQAQSTPATTPAPETVQPPKADTKEQAAGQAVSAARNLFARINGLGDQPKEEKKPVEKPQEQAAETKPAEEPKKPEEKPKAKPEEPVNPIFGKKKSKKAEAAELKDAVVEANRELIDTIKQTQKAPEPVQPKAPEPQLSKGDARLLEQLKKLEEIEPSYKDVSQKFLEFKAKEAAYEAEWLKAHPDEDFDPDAQEHQKFYERNEPSIDEDDLELAKEAIITERAEKKAREKVEREMEPLKAEQRHKEVVEKLAPKLTQTFEKVAREAAAQINPELGGLKELSQVAEKDPLAAEILSGVANHWLPVIQVAEFAYAGAKFDPESPEGQRLGAVVTEIEQGLLSLPKEDRSRSGKQFATLADYHKMSKAEQAKHWFVGADDITEYASYRMKLDGQKFYQQENERLDRLAASRGYVRNSGQGQPQSAQPKSQEQPANNGFRPAPSVGAAPSASTPSALRPDPNANPRMNVAKKLGWA